MDPEIRKQMRQQGGVMRAGTLRRRYRWETIDRWVRQGLLADGGRGWLTLPDNQDDVISQFRRAQIRTNHPLIACAHSAARFYGIEVVPEAGLHVTTSAGISVAVPPGVVLHQAPPRARITDWPDLRIVERAEAVVDVARTVAELDVLAVLDAAYRKGMSDAELETALALAGRRRGVRRVRRWLPFAITDSASPMESRARTRLLLHGLPEPEAQLRIATRTGVRYADLGWRRYRVGVDYEGEEFHTGDGRMAADRRRHNEVTDDGWTMLYPTKLDIYRRHREFCGVVERALHRAGWGGPLTPR